MRGLTTLIVFLPRVSSLLSRREVNDPAGEYLTRMCLPLLSNTTRSNELHLSIDGLIASLAYSPFPCEQQLYIETICEANGTTEIDFLAEQECLCGGAFWEAWLACSDCYFAHGEQRGTPAEAASALSSLSLAECTPSPPSQPFSNLLPVPNITSAELAPPISLGTDRFPNNTAVSNYFTVTQSMTPGQITGSATGRLKSWTNFSGVRYTPTSTATPSTSTSSNGAPASPGTTKNAATVAEARFAGSLLPVVVGLGMLL